ncbi:MULTISPECIES: hypothetical protein [Pseudomonas]|uniref:hypothetical protein n=1 Tax=Pseudomonas TaxID=286 RepID=UPI00037596B6|nr:MULTISPECIES: hypothetical protein [Pseudomonas]MCD4863154.1 hypothetical protein [Pseudomonas sp. PLB05]MDC7828327.1 hypothetical protein [Pseudomonas benzopyrenica]NRH43112.1 hypothetical protein [Pseudomonas sp. MS15a(2019)]UUW72417.1 hypothetical protein NRG74_03135 [Pseudomonas psychrotolerans]SEO97361.1 hypothetical protein SAMN02787149_102669 [Pseudomonas sp. Snoq117.2]
MTASRRPPRGAGRTAKPDSLRAAHEQITRNNGTLADIADLIEMEGKARPGRQQPDPSKRSRSAADSPTGTPQAKTVEQGSHGSFLAQPVFGIPLLALLVCTLILGAAVGVPLGVVTYGTALYTAVLDGMAIF